MKKVGNLETKKESSKWKPKWKHWKDVSQRFTSSCKLEGKKWKIRNPTEDWPFWWMLPYLSMNEGNIRNSVIKRLFRFWCKVAAKKTAQLNIPIRISWIVLLLTSLGPFFALFKDAEVNGRDSNMALTTYIPRVFRPNN